MLSYRSVHAVQGPLVFIQATEQVGYQEMVSIVDQQGKQVQGQVIALDRGTAVVQLFSNSSGLQIKDAQAVFAGEVKKISLSPSMLGRIFNGSGEPIDQYGAAPLPVEYRDINGSAINPYRRAKPHDFIQTGISAIDLTNTLVKGQKLPIFSENGLPDLEILTQIATQARTKDPNDKFVVVVAATGITYDQYDYLRSHLQDSGAMSRTVMFVNLAADPVVERILTPRLALTTAEYLAYDLDFSVLVLSFDLTNYANALREVSTSKKEIPGRGGYPGYLYTDLASLLERAGVVEGRQGSITQIPILSMPNGNITHPVPDLTGYITEGQIFLDRKLYKAGAYPPINILSSLSRLKDEAQGEGMTRGDHDQVANQVVASLAESQYQAELAMILGEGSLTETGRKYLEFRHAYQEEFLNQGRSNRSIEQTLDIAWKLFEILPREELKKLKDKTIAEFAPQILPQKQSTN